MLTQETPPPATTEATAPVDGAPPPETTTTAEATAPAGPVRPDGLPDAYWDEVAGIKPEAFTRLAELEAEAEARRAGIPEGPDGYKLELPETIVGLDGHPLTVDTSDPLAQALLPLLHKHGATQEMASEMLQAYAQAEMLKAQAIAAQTDKEIAALGARAGERLEAVRGGLTAAVGQEYSDALMGSVSTAKEAEALEALIAKLNAGVPPSPDFQPAPKEFEGLTGEKLLRAVRERQNTAR